MKKQSTLNMAHKSLFRIVSYFCLSLSLNCLANSTSANHPENELQSETRCMKDAKPYQFNLKHIESKGIGYDAGYTTLGGFFSAKGDRYIPFIDLRAHVFNYGKWAANAGIGTRYIFNPCKSLIGANLYYDYRTTKHKTHFNQIGLGIEAYYMRWELHANGYLPVGVKKREIKNRILSSGDDATFAGFSGNNILIDITSGSSLITYEGAMKGANAEIGVHLVGDRKQNDLYFGMGPYYYDLHTDRNAWGGKARLKAQVAKYLIFEVSDSYDRIFHNRFQGMVSLMIPFGGKHCYFPKIKQCYDPVMNWQGVLPPERQEIIVVDTFKKTATTGDPIVLAINPTTGLPYVVNFVQNNSGGSHAGTFENPYLNLGPSDGSPNAFSTPSDIVYVFFGDGTSTHMSGGNYQLVANQYLWGSGIDHPLQTTNGLITVTAQTPSMTPFIRGASDVVVLANNNEVSGFNITNTAFFAGCLFSNTIIDANINNNTFNNGNYAVFLSDISGVLTVDNNSALGQLGECFAATVQNCSAFITNNSATVGSSGNPTAGITTSSNGNSTITIENNTVTNPNNTPIGHYGIQIGWGSSVENRFNILDNTINVALPANAIQVQVPSIPPGSGGAVINIQNNN
jgi:hypothetical protein